MRKRAKFAPMLLVDVLVGLPFACEEWMAIGNNLASEECLQNRILIIETANDKIAAECVRRLVHSMNEHLHIGAVALVLLIADITSTTVQQTMRHEGRRLSWR